LLRQRGCHKDLEVALLDAAAGVVQLARVGQRRGGARHLLHCGQQRRLMSFDLGDHGMALALDDLESFF
jgi:hypothetical protein